MRTGEIFVLTWSDIDLDKRIIKINKTVYAKDSTENCRWYLGTTKLLGHSRIETTENYYITSTTNDLIKISESIEDEFVIKLIDIY